MRRCDLTGSLQACAEMSELLILIPRSPDRRASKAEDRDEACEQLESLVEKGGPARHSAAPGDAPQRWSSRRWPNLVRRHTWSAGKEDYPVVAAAAMQCPPAAPRQRALEAALAWVCSPPHDGFGSSVRGLRKAEKMRARRKEAGLALLHNLGFVRTMAVSGKALSVLSWVLLLLASVDAQRTTGKELMITPNILTGILIGSLWIAVFLVGFCCLFAVQTPAAFEEKALVINKNY
eukprot:s2129_g15.t2